MMTVINAKIEENRRALLAECTRVTGLTQAQLAKKIGVKSQGHLATWFIKSKNRPLERALKFQQVTGIDWRRFVNDEDVEQFEELLAESRQGEAA